MSDIAIYGAGGLGRELACLIRMINEAAPRPLWRLIGFFDDGRQKGEANEYGPILGGMAEANAWAQPLCIAIGIGSPKIVKKIGGGITNVNISFPNIIAPTTRFLDRDRFSMGKGNIVCHDCTFSTNVHIGDFNVFNGSVCLGHDTSMGSYNSVMPNVRISGEVEIGCFNFFGVSSVVLQQKRIGQGVTVGAGSVVMRNTADNATYVGNPATRVKF